MWPRVIARPDLDHPRGSVRQTSSLGSSSRPSGSTQSGHGAIAQLLTRRAASLPLPAVPCRAGERRLLEDRLDPDEVECGPRSGGPAGLWFLQSLKISAAVVPVGRKMSRQ